MNKNSFFFTHSGIKTARYCQITPATFFYYFPEKGCIDNSGAYLITRN